jgi:hypothetical protein
MAKLTAPSSVLKSIRQLRNRRIFFSFFVAILIFPMIQFDALNVVAGLPIVFAVLLVVWAIFSQKCPYCDWVLVYSADFPYSSSPFLSSSCPRCQSDLTRPLSAENDRWKST